MKKIFLTAIALISIASTQVFGSYGVSDWITFLTDGNRFEAKLDQLGFTLGNDMIKGTFGFHNDGRGANGSMLLPGTGTTTDGLTPRKNSLIIIISLMNGNYYGWINSMARFLL